MPQAFDAAKVFDAMGTYWAEIADRSNTERQLWFLKSQLERSSYVLDLACGTGRHTIPLQKQGYGIVGLDVSVNLLRIAKQRFGGATLVCGDMRFLPFKEATFSAVISMDTSIGYLPSEKEDAESIAEAQRVLGGSGVFIVDVFNRQNLTAKYQDKAPVTKNIEYPSFHLQQKRQLGDGGRLLCDTWTIRCKTDGEVRVFNHTVRLYDLNQLRGLLESVSFTVEQVFGDYEVQEFSADFPRLIIVAAAEKKLGCSV